MRMRTIIKEHLFDLAMGGGLLALIGYWNSIFAGYLVETYTKGAAYVLASLGASALIAYLCFYLSPKLKLQIVTEPSAIVGLIVACICGFFLLVLEGCGVIILFLKGHTGEAFSLSLAWGILIFWGYLRLKERLKSVQ